MLVQFPFNVLALTLHTGPVDISGVGLLFACQKLQRTYNTVSKTSP